MSTNSYLGGAKIRIPDPKPFNPQKYADQMIAKRARKILASTKKTLKRSATKLAQPKQQLPRLSYKMRKQKFLDEKLGGSIAIENNNIEELFQTLKGQQNLYSIS